MISLIFFYFLVFTSFIVLLFQSARHLGRNFTIILLGFIALNILFLIQTPFYSDDIYNHSISDWFMSDFFTHALGSYHYARFPFTMFAVMGTLKYFFQYAILAHLLLFLTHGLGILILSEMLFRYLKMPKLFYLCLLLVLFSLNSNVENLLWFAAVHENFSLMFVSFSVLSLTKAAESKMLRHKIIFYLLCLLFQIFAIMSSEVGYLLLFIQPIFFFLASCPKLNLKSFLTYMVRSVFVFPVMLAALLLYRFLLSYFFHLPFFSSPYQVNLDSNLLLFFSKKIVFFPFTPFLDFFAQKSSVIGATILLTSLIVFSVHTRTNDSLVKKENLKSLLRTSIVAFLFFLASIIQIFPHAIVATTLHYNFPRFSYLFGIFIYFSFFCFFTAIENLRFKRFQPIISGGLVFGIIFLTFIQIFNWTAKVLVRIPSTRNYILNFEQGLKTDVGNQISPNSLVVFSFTDEPPASPLVSYIRQYDLLQWNHGIIGYFNSSFVPNLPTNVYPMPLDQQNVHDLNNLNLTLTGSYWVKYGNDPQAAVNLIRELNIQHISHYYYDGQKIRLIPIHKLYLYKSDYTVTLSNQL
jgi:hypothetical protein